MKLVIAIYGILTSASSNNSHNASKAYRKMEDNSKILSNIWSVLPATISTTTELMTTTIYTIKSHLLKVPDLHIDVLKMFPPSS